MSVREEERNKNCPSRGLGIAAAAIGVGVGAALYYIFSKRTENPADEGATSSGWVSEEPHTLNSDHDSNSYTTISEHSTSDTSILESSQDSDSSGLTDIHRRRRESITSTDDDSSYQVSTPNSTEYTISDEDMSDVDSPLEDLSDVHSPSVNVQIPLVQIDQYTSSWVNSDGDSSPFGGRIYSYTAETGYTSDTQHSASSDGEFSHSSAMNTSNNSNVMNTSYNSNVMNTSYNSNVMNTGHNSNANTNIGSDSETNTEWDVTTSSLDVPRAEVRPSSPIMQLGELTVRLLSTPARRFRKSAAERITKERVFRERSWSLEECSICFEVMLKDQDIMSLVCTHRFHQACIMPWLQEKQTCPNCRKAS